MKVTISDHMRDVIYTLEGEPDSVKQQIAQRLPYLADAAEHLSVLELVEEIDRHPYYFADLDASPAEMNDMLSEETDDESEEPNAEAENQSLLPLPRGLREFVHFGDDEDS